MQKAKRLEESNIYEPSVNILSFRDVSINRSTKPSPELLQRYVDENLDIYKVANSIYPSETS